ASLPPAAVSLGVSRRRRSRLHHRAPRRSSSSRSANRASAFRTLSFCDRWRRRL
ncbi:unnamed protein product, partial [Citrullus colocynthis]